MSHRIYLARAFLVVSLWFIFTTYYKVLIDDQKFKLYRLIGTTHLNISEVQEVHHKLLSIVLVHKNGRIRITNLINNFSELLQTIYSRNSKIIVKHYRE